MHHDHRLDKLYVSRLHFYGCFPWFLFSIIVHHLHWQPRPYYKRLNLNTVQGYGRASPAIWEHIVLPVTLHRWIRPQLTKAMLAAGDRYSINLSQRDGRLSLPWCLLYADIIYLSQPVVDSRPNHLIATWPGLITNNSIVVIVSPTPYQYSTESPSVRHCITQATQWHRWSIRNFIYRIFSVSIVATDGNWRESRVRLGIAATTVDWDYKTSVDRSDDHSSTTRCTVPPVCWRSNGCKVHHIFSHVSKFKHFLRTMK